MIFYVLFVLFVEDDDDDDDSGCGIKTCSWILTFFSILVGGLTQFSLH